MNPEYLGILLIVATMVGLSYPLGSYMARVYEGKSTWLDFLSPLESGIYKLSGLGAKPADWTVKQNIVALLMINAIFFIWAFVVLLMQGSLPFNPDNIPGMEVTQAFNTAVSFMTNTNLQHYSGETGASYFTQMFVFTFLQFVSAGTGMAACVLIFKAIAKETDQILGNFFTLMLRSCTRVLLPLSIITSLLLLVSGSPMVLHGADTITTLEGATQTIATGPVAAMVAIKQLGTNGGGYFGPNSTHPLENPNYLTNAVENLSILLIPMAMVWCFGFITKRKKLSLILFGVMFTGFFALLLPTITSEVTGTEAMAKLGLDLNHGNMEGKELRFGPGASALWGVSTTCTSNGSVNAMHDSFTALGGMSLMLGMMVNSFFGGVGVGFINFYIFMILATFLAGLMVGRTPELMGKKLSPAQVKLAAAVFLLHPLLIMTGTAMAAWAATEGSLTWTLNPGFHGLSEMLYEYTSASANNGSGFEGLGDNTPFWNLTTGLVMLLARFIPIVYPLIIAGQLAEKQFIPVTSGTLKEESSAYAIVLSFTIIILSVLAFLPALIMGPIGEHLASIF